MSTVGRTHLLPRGRFEALDSLRGVAALGVLWGHFFEAIVKAEPPVLGFSGLLVDFFFVLSGFVIAKSYGHRLASGLSPGRFVLLRLGRIYPLHAAMAIVLAIGFLARQIYLDLPLGLPAGDLLRAVFMVDGLFDYRVNIVSPVSWSLSVEMVLYVLAALLFRARRVGAPIAVGICLVAVVLIVLQRDLWVVGGMLQRGLSSFILGIGCWIVHRRGRLTLSRASATFIEGGLLLGGGALLSIHGDIWSWILPADLLFAAIVLTFAQERGLISSVLRARPLMFFGKVSFSIYLTHPLALRTVAGLAIATHFGSASTRASTALPFDPPSWVWQLVLTFGLTIAFSVVTFRWIEEPARRWSRRRFATPGGPAERTLGTYGLDREARSGMVWR